MSQLRNSHMTKHDVARQMFVRAYFQGFRLVYTRFTSSLFLHLPCHHQNDDRDKVTSVMLLVSILY